MRSPSGQDSSPGATTIPPADTVAVRAAAPKKERLRQGSREGELRK